MSFHISKHALSLRVATVIITAPVLAGAADPDWKAVEQALGKSGQLQTGDVFRIGMPRTDLAVTAKGVVPQGPVGARVRRRFQADRKPDDGHGRPRAPRPGSAAGNGRPLRRR